MSDHPEPLMVTVSIGYVKRIGEALLLGLESIQEELAQHDAAIGRDRPRGMREALRLEAAIREVQECAEIVNKITTYND